MSLQDYNQNLNQLTNEMLDITETADLIRDGFPFFSYFN